MLRSDCAYAQAGLSLCWSHMPHYWKSHIAAHIYIFKVQLLQKRLPFLDFSILSSVNGSAWRTLLPIPLCFQAFYL